MIVVDGLVVPAGVLDDVVDEGDAALGQPIPELELLEHLDLLDSIRLRALARLQRLRADIRVRHANFLRLGRDGWRRRPAAAENQRAHRHERKPGR